MKVKAAEVDQKGDVDKWKKYQNFADILVCGLSAGRNACPTILPLPWFKIFRNPAENGIAAVLQWLVLYFVEADVHFLAFFCSLSCSLSCALSCSLSTIGFH